MAPSPGDELPGYHHSVPTGRVIICRNSRHFVPGYHRFVAPGQKSRFFNPAAAGPGYDGLKCIQVLKAGIRSAQTRRKESVAGLA
jgi:hypothetical protein